jgi:hypothetical protein
MHPGTFTVVSIEHGGYLVLAVRERSALERLFARTATEWSLLLVVFPGSPMEGRHVRKLPKMAAGLVMAGAMLGTASPAVAAPWGSSSSPYVVYTNGTSGWSLGRAYGDFFNDGAQYSRNNSYQWDYVPGGNGIYVVTGHQYNDDGSLWYTYTSTETDRTTTASWVYDWTRAALRGSNDRVRGKLQVCEDQSFSGDPCSASGYVTFSY